MSTKVSERAAIVATIDPASLTANTYVSDWVDMGTFESIMAVLLLGTISSGGTVNAKLRQAKDSSGTDAKDITGKALAELTQAGTDSNKQAILVAMSDELDSANGFRYVALSVTTATAAALGGAVVLGFNPNYGPASDYDLASVDEIVG